MNWRQLISLTRNEGINTGGRGLQGPVISGYYIEGETAKEFYQRERSRNNIEVGTPPTTDMISK